MLIIFTLFFVIAALLVLLCLRLVHKVTKKWVGFLFAATLVLPGILNEAYQYHSYAKAIPEQIGITYPVSTHDEWGCGALVFKVSDDTLAMIKKGGLAFFAGATQGRGHPGNRYYQYAQWKETPVPPSWTSEGSWMFCTTLSNGEHSKIVSAAKSGGAYYTTKDEGELILIPSLGYVVYSFLD